MENNSTATDPPDGKAVAPADASFLLRSLPSVNVSVARLLPSDSARFQLRIPGHVQTLAEAEADLGPILVHRPTMRVIDGMHRLHAAIARGEEEIAVQFFDGDRDDAFVLSVQLNVRHGMPLTLAERKNAAARIVRSHPHWSDRAIAECSGLSSKTVGKLRKHAGAEIPQLNARMGRDGRIRPVSSAEGRRNAATHLIAEPHLPLRELADRSGVSVGTVRDVRERLRRGEDPLPARRRAAAPPPVTAREGGFPGADGGGVVAGARTAEGARVAGGAGGGTVHRRGLRGVREPDEIQVDVPSLLRRLAQDPAFRGTESGRLLLRMLLATELEDEQWRTIVKNIPSHCMPVVRAIAAKRAEEWKRLADSSPSFNIPVADRPA